MNINKELTYSKLTSIDKVISGMQVNYFFIILMFFVVLWVPVSIMTVLTNIKHLMNPEVFVICGTMIFLFLLIPISLKLGKKKSYIDIAFNNCKKFQISEDLQQLAEDVNASLRKEIVYKSHSIVATDEYLLLWGDDDTFFNPIIIPRKMIVKSEILYRKKGIYGENRRINVMGVFTLSNGLKVEAILCGQFEKKVLEKLIDLNIINF
ncbi:MAG: hypothetical protein MJ235_08960 [archaeon]|nr:hypothetical protein [archaeon]